MWAIFFNSLLTAAGIFVALMLGLGQLKLQENQVKIQENQVKIQESQKEIAALAAQTSRQQALSSLIILLGDDKTRVRKLAAISLAQFGNDAIEPLLLVLGDDEKEVRLAAVDTLLKICDLHEPKIVIERLKNRIREVKHNELANKNFIECSVIILVDTKLDELIHILENSESGLFYIAIDILKERECIKPLKKLLEYKLLPLENRRYIISAFCDIASLGGKQIVPYLIEVSESQEQDPEIRIATINALDNIMRICSMNGEIASSIKKSFLHCLEDDNESICVMSIKALERYCKDPEVRSAFLKVAKSRGKKRQSGRLIKSIIDSEQCK